MIAIFKRYPSLRGSTIGAHFVILIILASLLNEYNSVFRVCYGVILGVRKLLEVYYAAPQGISYCAEVILQWKALYFNLDTVVVLLSAALQGIGYVAGKTIQAVVSWCNYKLDILYDPTPPWELPGAPGRTATEAFPRPRSSRTHP